MGKFYLFSEYVSYIIKMSLTLAFSHLMIAFGQGAVEHDKSYLPINSIVPVAATLTTNVTVGVGQTYTTLTKAGGLFAALNAGTFTGDIVANIKSDINESGAVSLNEFAGSLKIQSDGTMRTLWGATTANTIPLICINGADNVTFDGGVGKLLTFKNYTAGVGAKTGPVIQVQGGSTNCVITNCNIQSNSSSTTTSEITIGSGINSVSISYCDIRDVTNVPGVSGAPQYGIYSNTITNTISITNNNIYNWKTCGVLLFIVADKSTISGNSFFMQANSSVAQTAIYVGGSNNHSITGNFIGGQSPKCGGLAWKNIGTETGNNVIGIYLKDITAPASIIQGNTIQNIIATGSGILYGIQNYGGRVTVRKNKILNIDAAAKAYGVYNDKASGVCEFSNNMIAIGGGSKYIYGFFDNSTTDTIHFYNNSINIYGTITTVSSYAFMHNFTIPVITPAPYYFKNNILSNIRIGGSGNHYAIYCNPTTGFTSDYNDLFASGTSIVLGNWGGYDKANLDVWKTDSGMDSHSVSILPGFKTDVDLHISDNPSIAIQGTPVSVLDDIDSIPRGATPDMGINQFSPLITSNWTGTESSDWNTLGNWSTVTNAIPTASVNVLIPNVLNKPVINQAPESPAVCNNLTIESGAVLTIAAGKVLTVNGILTNNNTTGTVGISIQSNSTGTGSLITKAASGTGSVEAQRWMAAGKWNIVSSPLSGQSVNSFLILNDNIATTTSGVPQRGMLGYDPNSNEWNFTDQTSGNLEAGKGFSMRVKGLTAGVNDAAVTFTGSLQAGTLSPFNFIPGLWNCVGNPYTSAIAMNVNSTSGTALNFLTENKYNLDQNNGAIYVWEEPDASNGLSGKYKTYSNATVAFDVQQGQAFMVKMNTSVTSVSFTKSMQFHAPSLPLKSSQTPWPTIKLAVSVGSQQSSTIIAFNSAMTKGLDPTYDAGLLKGGTDLLVYSRLVEDNGISFAIQALPDNDYGNMIIPIGLDFKAGGEVIFSSEVINLPPNNKVILEDMLSKTFTDLSTTTYKTTIAANSVITDRFRLKITTTTTGLDKETPADKLTVYANRNIEIIVKGRVSKNAFATLYDVHGRVVLIKNLEDGNMQIIPLPKIKIGIYMLSVSNNGKLNGFKILIRE